MLGLQRINAPHQIDLAVTQQRQAAVFQHLFQRALCGLLRQPGVARQKQPLDIVGVQAHQRLQPASHRGQAPPLAKREAPQGRQQSLRRQQPLAGHPAIGAEPTQRAPHRIERERDQVVKTAWLQIAQEQMEVPELAGAARVFMRMEVELCAVCQVARIMGGIVPPGLEARRPAERQLGHAAPALRRQQRYLHRVQRGLRQ
ncbi:hypothetical protein DES47_104456 [Roseateles toxinivorans]|uniref:Uncharacterized protein n=1 Tax=Roseateles toxinivorans TaxID=270368 RepID=A0A4R6QLC8_9BURK|nr:hypothetical protein DES47_104456 [Roseateles toxinivorans]